MSKQRKNPDLWPDDLLQGDKDNSLPVRILQEQSDFLLHKTENLIGARIEGRQPSGEGRGNTCYVFVLYATQMYFSYELFFIEYAVKSPYPVCVSEVEDFGFDKNQIEASSEQSFREILRTIFASGTTRRIIANLVEQSRIVQSQAA
jgi:hypothetical protein